VDGGRQGDVHEEFGCIGRELDDRSSRLFCKCL
jgi:hypothetical protein